MARFNGAELFLIDSRGLYDYDEVPRTDKEVDSMVDSCIKHIMNQEYRSDVDLGQLVTDAADAYEDDPLLLSIDEQNADVYVELNGNNVYMTNNGQRLRTLDEAKRWLASNV